MPTWDLSRIAAAMLHHILRLAFKLCLTSGDGVLHGLFLAPACVHTLLFLEFFYKKPPGSVILAGEPA